MKTTIRTEHHDNGKKREDEVVTTLKEKLNEYKKDEDFYKEESLRNSVLRELMEQEDDPKPIINYDEIRRIASSKFIGRVELEEGVLLIVNQR